MAGEDITAAPLHERARHGLALAWQEPARFEGLRVGDYLALGARAAPDDCLDQVGLAPADYLDLRLQEEARAVVWSDPEPSWPPAGGRVRQHREAQDLTGVAVEESVRGRIVQRALNDIRVA